jgi:dipeptidyl aminopeptidase/acylaminoacyl peptidase
MAMVNSTAGSLDLQQPDGQTVNIFPPGSTVNAITWSADSRHLLVVRTNWVFNQPEGTGVSSSGPIAIWQVEIEADKVQPAKQLFQSPTLAGQDAAEQIRFSHWSPNSRHVLFWLGPLSASILADGLPLAMLDVTTGQVTQVAEWALLNPRYQSWAPDSSVLAVAAGGYRSAQVSKWLTLFDVASGQVTAVVSQTEQIPGIVAWSPQGDLIAYAAVPATETGEEWANLMTFDNPAIAGRRIYLLDPATGQYRRLNEVESYQDAPLWSDDGSRLYYVQLEGDAIPEPGTKTTRVTTKMSTKPIATRAPLPAQYRKPFTFVRSASISLRANCIVTPLTAPNSSTLDSGPPIE